MVVWLETKVEGRVDGWRSKEREKRVEGKDIPP